MKPLFYAVAFLTRIPVPFRFDARDRTKSTAYYPLVGLLIGGVIAAFDGLIAVHFPPLVRAVLVTACWVFITGGLHLDGLMDVFDGLGSHREPERILAIMKDSRVGAMGVLAAVLILLLKDRGPGFPDPFHGFLRHRRFRFRPDRRAARHRRLALSAGKGDCRRT